MKNKKLLAHYIKDPFEREKYLKGVAGHYRVTDLPFDKVAIKNNDDEQNLFFLIDLKNTYTFENCVLEDLNFNSQIEMISFKNCIFKGDIVINNVGLDDESQVCLTDNNKTESLDKILIKSPTITLFDSYITSNKFYMLGNSFCAMNSAIIAEHKRLLFSKEFEMEHCYVNGEVVGEKTAKSYCKRNH